MPHIVGNGQSAIAPTLVAKRRDVFGAFAAGATRLTGSRWAFLLAILSILIWALLGPTCHYSDNWQLVINTGTTIVTFLMVFLIQNAQNRESKAVHLKLDELIRALRDARNEMIDIENLTEEQLERLGQGYTRLAEQQQHRLAAVVQERCPDVRGESNN